MAFGGRYLRPPFLSRPDYSVRRGNQFVGDSLSRVPALPRVQRTDRRVLRRSPLGFSAMPRFPPGLFLVDGAMRLSGRAITRTRRLYATRVPNTVRYIR